MEPTGPDDSPPADPPYHGVGLSELYERLKNTNLLLSRAKEQLEHSRKTLMCLDHTKPEDGQTAADNAVLRASVRDRLQDQQNGLRQAINHRSRPLLRPLGVLDMPDEILLLIFDFVNRSAEPHAPNIDPALWDRRFREACRDVQNGRLVCRRFCSTGSRFLVSFINVDVSEKRLNRLDQISRHPTIRLGVQGIRVGLGLVDPVLATNFQQFVEQSCHRLLNRADALEWSASCFPMPDADCEAELKASKMLRKIIGVWRDLAAYGVVGSSTGHDEEYADIIRRAFQKHHRLFVQQQDLFQNGGYIRAITSAMSRMPAAKTLAIMDSEVDSRGEYSGPPFRTLLSDERLMCEALTEHRVSWRRQFEQSLGDDSVPLLPELLVGLESAGVYIHHLSINLTLIRDFARLETSAQDRQTIASALGRLRRFGFCQGVQGLGRTRKELEVLRDFLGAVTSADSLYDMSVLLNLWGKDGALDPENLPRVGIIKTNKTSASPAMSYLRIASSPMHYSDLKALLDSASTGSTIFLSKIHLLDGSWADALDLLRERHGNAKIKAPSGAECENMEAEVYERIFGAYEGIAGWESLNEARRYIRQKSEANPLRHALTALYSEDSEEDSEYSEFE